jgi:hypothetical protein
VSGEWGVGSGEWGVGSRLYSPPLEGCQAQPDGVVLTGEVWFCVAPTTPPLRGTPPEEGNKDHSALYLAPPQAGEGPEALKPLNYNKTHFG